MSNDTFKWDDNTVKEFINFCRRSHSISDIDYLGMDIEKFKKSKEPKPLFTTSDGVQIFEGMEYWYLLKDNLVPYKCTYAGKGFEPPITFSTKEKAEEWLLLNQPCLSVNDILNISNWQYENTPEVIRLRKSNLTNMAKQKLSQ